MIAFMLNAHPLSVEMVKISDGSSGKEEIDFIIKLLKMEEKEEFGERDPIHLPLKINAVGGIETDCYCDPIPQVLPAESKRNALVRILFNGCNYYGNFVLVPTAPYQNVTDCATVEKWLRELTAFLVKKKKLRQIKNN